MTVSFIGMGNMAYAIARGLLEAGALHGEQVAAYDPNPQKIALLEQDFGARRAQTLEQAVALCARLLPLFEENNIRVIRLGLHTVEEESLLAGPWHPAFSELCYSRRYLEAFTTAFAGRKAGDYTLLVAAGEQSKATGQKRCNLSALKEQGWNVKIQESPTLSPGRFEIIQGRNPICC